MRYPKLQLEICDAPSEDVIRIGAVLEVVDASAILIEQESPLYPIANHPSR